MLGAASLDWNPDRRAFLLRAQQGQQQNKDQSKDRNYAAWIGSPTANSAQSGAKSANQADSSSGESSFLLGATPRGTDKKLVVIAASLDGPPDAAVTYDRLVRDTAKLAREAESYYADYLRHTLSITVPDAEIQQAYDWARIDLLQARVDNPVVGSGLIAGYGPSGTHRPGFVESQRPGFDWFFGRDALWTTLALDSEGDFSDARTALELLAKYQRADGKIPHEISQSAGLVDWFGEYPYGYAAADATPLFLIAASDYVEHSGDVGFAREKWDSIQRAYQFLNSTLDAGRLRAECRRRPRMGGERAAGSREDRNLSSGFRDRSLASHGELGRGSDRQNREPHRIRAGVRAREGPAERAFLVAGEKDFRLRHRAK